MVQKIPREYLPISRSSGKRIQKEKYSLLKRYMRSCFCREGQVSESKEMKTLEALRLRIQRVLLIIDKVPEYSLEGLEIKKDFTKSK